MITISEMKTKVEIYVKDKLDDKKMILEPMFRLQDNQLYMGFLVFDFYDEVENDFRIKRPMHWVLVDVEAGNIEWMYHSIEYDYTEKEDFPYDLVFLNENHTILFDYNDYIMKSFNKWKRRTNRYMKTKMNHSNYLYSMKMLKRNDEYFSVNDYFERRLLEILEQCKEMLMLETGDKIHNGYQEYVHTLIDKIRIAYIEHKKIDVESNYLYLQALKYAWPDQIEIINHFDNICMSNDSVYDNSLREQIASKELKKLEENKNIGPTLDAFISAIDQKISELEKKE